MANDRSIPKKYQGKSIWSYSRLNNYLTCPYGYYLQYVLKLPSKQNIYSSVGSIVHELLEKLQTRSLTNEQAVEQFNIKFDEMVLGGIDFTREQEKKNFIYSVKNYLLTYKPVECYGFRIERKEFIEIDSQNVLLMFIDLIIKRNEDTISVYDYKTSSKYTKKDMEKAGRQLVLYAHTLLSNYPKFKNADIAWLMLKYVNVTYNKRCVQISRHGLVIELKDKIYKEMDKLGIVDLEANEIFADAVSTNTIPEIVADKFTIEPCIIPYPFNEETIGDMLDFVNGTIKAINEDKEFKAVEITEKNSFFCNVLCGQSLNCDKLRKFNEGREQGQEVEEGDLF